MTPDSRWSSIAIHATISQADQSWFERWFAAVLEAVSGVNTAVPGLKWRIVLGTGATADATLATADRERRVQLAGGRFETVAIEPGLGRAGAHAQLLSTGAEDLVLVLDEHALITPNALSRLIESLGEAVLAADARVLPIESAERACLLFLRRALDVGGLTLAQLLRERSEPQGTERLLRSAVCAAVGRLREFDDR